MSVFKIILFITGFGLLILGSFSGYAIFSRSLKPPKNTDSNVDVGSLWGLFLIGISCGLFLTWLALF